MGCAFVTGRLDRLTVLVHICMCWTGIAQPLVCCSNMLHAYLCLFVVLLAVRTACNVALRDPWGVIEGLSCCLHTRALGPLVCGWAVSGVRQAGGGQPKRQAKKDCQIACLAT